MDSVCKLIGKTQTGRDRYGNPIEETTERTVFCQVLSVTRSEFYQAASAGLSPEYIIRLQDIAEYEGEKLVEYDGELFSVLRVYRDRGSMGHNQPGATSPMSSNWVELTIGRKIGNE